METLASEPVNADNASGAATEVDSEVVATEGADSAPAAAETGKPERDKVQERFDKLTREKYEGLSRAERAEYRAQLAEQRLADLEAQRTATKETVAPSDDFPTLESCDYDEGKLRIALDAYFDRKIETRAKAALAEAEKGRQRETTLTTWQQREAELIKSKPDYVEKVQRATVLPITKDMQEALMQMDDGPELALYLVENREKAEAIMRLPMMAQLVELGTIRASVKAAKVAPVKPAVSQAPPPVPKLDTADAKVEKDPSQMTDKEFAKWREKQIAQRGSR